MTTDTGSQRLPPYNITKEDALIGCVLLDRNVLPRVLPLVSSADFYQDRAGTIWAAMAALYERDEPVTFLSIPEELAKGLSEKAVTGMVQYMSGVLGDVITTLDAESYAKAIASDAALRRLISAGGRIAALGLQGQVDPEIAVEEAERILGEVVDRRSQSEFLTAPDLVTTYVDEITALRDGTSTWGGITTGLPDLDLRLSGGWMKGDLITVGARPSMGKTAVSLNFALAAASQGLTTVMFSMEMGASRIAERLVSTASGIPSRILRSTTELNKEQVSRLSEGVGRVASMQFFIDDTPNLSVPTLRSRLKRLALTQPVNLVIVDHIQLMTSGRRQENRVQEMADISRQLKGLARELDVPVIALCQLSRAVESRAKRVPQMSDLRESGSIEQDSDVVILLFRESYYDPETPRQGVIDLIVAKHRNGETGTVEAFFSLGTGRIAGLQRGEV